MPVAIDDVSGIVKMTRKAGNASSSSFQRMLVTAPIIMLPTMINAGDVIAEIPETALTSGLKNSAAPKSTATVKDVSPVLPPAATPADDSI